MCRPWKGTQNQQKDNIPTYIIDHVVHAEINIFKENFQFSGKIRILYQFNGMTHNKILGDDDF